MVKRSVTTGNIQESLRVLAGTLDKKCTSGAPARARIFGSLSLRFHPLVSTQVGWSVFVLKGRRILAGGERSVTTGTPRFERQALKGRLTEALSVALSGLGGLWPSFPVVTQSLHHRLISAAPPAQKACVNTFGSHRRLISAALPARNLSTRSSEFLSRNISYLRVECQP